MTKRFMIHILHKPTGFNLCEDGVFRSGVTFIYQGTDTLMYRSVGHGGNSHEYAQA